MKKHSHKSSEKIVKLVHEYLGENSQKPILDEVADHMKDCPDCYIYVDSVQQTIQLMKKIDLSEKCPKSVEHRLLKSLKIES
jgi:hypothetical protein